MTEAIFAQGTLLKLGDGGSPETFTTISEVRSINGPTLGADTVEVTSHDSPLGYREFIAGLLQAGELSFELNFQPTDATHDAQTGLIAAMQSRSTRNFQLVFPGAIATWQFSAFVTRFEMGAPVDSNLKATVTLQITGQPNFAA
jgi:predicted secreted protein